MGSLSKKLFKKTKAVTHEKAVKVGVEAYKKRRDEEGHKLYVQFLAMVLVALHNRCGFGYKRLFDTLRDVNDLMEGLKQYPGNPVAEAKRILLDECKFDLEKEYLKLMKEQA